jgi:hypothetical protein
MHNNMQCSDMTPNNMQCMDMTPNNMQCLDMTPNPKTYEKARRVLENKIESTFFSTSMSVCWYMSALEQLWWSADRSFYVLNDDKSCEAAMSILPGW